MKTYAATRRQRPDDPEAYVRRAVVTANLSRFRRRRVVEDLVDVVPEPAVAPDEQFAPVLEAYPRAQCPPTADTVPAVDRSECYRLAPESIEIREVRDLETGLDPTAVAPGESGVALYLSLTEEDAKKFYALTKKVAPRPPPQNRLAFVLAGKVYVAPTTEAIPGGLVMMRFDDETQLWAFLTALGR